jgi:hypothetical protein
MDFSLGQTLFAALGLGRRIPELAVSPGRTAGPAGDHPLLHRIVEVPGTDPTR